MVDLKERLRENRESLKDTIRLKDMLFNFVHKYSALEGMDDSLEALDERIEYLQNQVADDQNALDPKQIKEELPDNWDHAVGKEVIKDDDWSGENRDD